MDCLRGMAMLMVVFCHVGAQFCLDLQHAGVVPRVFNRCMLPTFFFVSGYFSPLMMTMGGGN